jgi:carbonic anhydrase/acetyltransferase-like protein (isoleucine patch superfamily)
VIDRAEIFDAQRTRHDLVLLLSPICVNSTERPLYSNIQDNAVLHLADDFACVLGKYVTVGHSAIVHACTIGDEVLISMGAVVGKQSLIGAKALVTQGMKIPPGSLVLGAPAKVVRQLTAKERAGLKHWATKYVVNGAYCLKHGINVGAPLDTSTGEA